MHFSRRALGAVSLFLAILAAGFRSDSPSLHVVTLRTSQQLKEFLRYTPDRIPLVSAHRGGARKGFPENCIATFENTLTHTFALLEIDPRFTKDSALVLMHDKTLERTSNGQGNVSAYTLAELKKLRLKDTDANITAYGIPTLDETLEWAKGKTILVIDQKDVPLEKRVRKIEEHQAEAHAMIIAYSFEDAQKCYQLNPNIMMEVMLPDVAKCEEFEKTGIPWQNIVAFVTHTVPKDAAVFEYLHRKGVMCIQGSSRTLDRAYQANGMKDEKGLQAGYRRMLDQGADIIEADLGIEAGRFLWHAKPAQSVKQQYFK